jgi:ribosome-associated translation inhibitor RaiA
MQVLLRTDNHIEGTQELTNHVESVVTESLSRFGPQVTRVEVHLADLNSKSKTTEHDTRCTMEARLGGLNPVTVSHVANTVHQAIDGAAETLVETLERTVGKIGNKKGRVPYGGETQL